mmetsp:Transcript_41322/g.76365  ORF Transcript_41322/g.76365 Transcript_41322/m.76365 type:complete len:95 (+) Transcript_41322:921-1205(+)
MAFVHFLFERGRERETHIACVCVREGEGDRERENMKETDDRSTNRPNPSLRPLGASATCAEGWECHLSFGTSWGEKGTKHMRLEIFGDGMELVD